MLLLKDISRATINQTQNWCLYTTFRILHVRRRTRFSSGSIGKLPQINILRKDSNPPHDILEILLIYSIPDLFPSLHASMKTSATAANDANI